jgi:hypothetical protein
MPVPLLAAAVAEIEGLTEEVVDKLLLVDVGGAVEVELEEDGFRELVFVIRRQLLFAVSQA